MRVLLAMYGYVSDRIHVPELCRARNKFVLTLSVGSVFFKVMTPSYTERRLI